MKKVSVTYHAVKGDDKVTEAFGHTFFDGKAEEVIVSAAALDKLRNNRNFEVGKDSDVSEADLQKAAVAKAAADTKVEHKGR
jgi:hypothetical protein